MRAAWSRIVFWALRWLGGRKQADAARTKEQSAEIPAQAESTVTPARQTLTHARLAELKPDGSVALYLTHLGLAGVLHDMPRLSEHSAGRRFPVMVAELVDIAGSLRGLHHTHLAGDSRGCAPRKHQREMKRLGNHALSGTSIRLYDATDKVAIAVGIEPALAVRLKTGWPVWAAPSAALMAVLQLPASITNVRIYANRLELAAATRLARRLRARHRRIEIIAAETALIGTASAERRK